MKLKTDMNNEKVILIAFSFIYLVAAILRDKDLLFVISSVFTVGSLICCYADRLNREYINQHDLNKGES